MRIRSVSFRAVMIIGMGSLRRRFSRIISISLVISLALSALSVVKDISSLGECVSDKVNVDYLDSDLIFLHYPRNANSGYLEIPFDDAKIDEIRNKYEVSEIVPIYMQQEPWLFSNGSRTFEGVIKQVNADEFFSERIGSFDINGRTIEKDDEIILAEDTAGYLFEGECIGRKVTLNDGMGSGIEMTIVGVNRTVNPFDKIYSIVSSGRIKMLLAKQLDNDLENRMELHAFNNESEFREIQVDTGGIYGRMTAVTGDEVLVYGELPLNDGDIMISSAVFPYALKGFDVPGEDFAVLASRDIAVKHNGLFKVRISGVYKSEEIGMKFMPSFITKLKEIEPVALEVYIPASQDVSVVKRRIEAEDGLKCSLQLENLKMNVLRQTAFFKWAILFAGAILAIISLAMLGSFSKLAVLERKKEIAVVKSLGASDPEVLLILWSDSLCISVISVFMAASFTGVFTFVVPYMLPELAFAEFRFPVGSFIVFAVMFFIAVLLFTLTGMRRLVRTMPAELMRNA